MKKWMLAVLAPCVLFAIDEQPWFSPSLEPQLELKYLYQTFNDVDTHSGALSYRARDSFATFHLGMSAFEMFDAQLEVVGAATKAHSFNYDHTSLTLRYLILDDVIGDFVSWDVGVTGIQAIRQAVHDISSFHHGELEGELFTAVGKEYSCWDYWTSRWWVYGALGSADTGSAWTRANAAIDFQMPWRNQFFRLFANSLWGLGRNNLVTLDDFQGYGPIKHQSVDLGFRYSYQFPYCGLIYVEYARRVMAKNFPKQVDLFTISYTRPFGL